MKIISHFDIKVLLLFWCVILISLANIIYTFASLSADARPIIIMQWALEQKLNVWEAYVEQWALVYDENDWFLDGQLEITGKVDVDTPWEYVLSYKARNSLWNYSINHYRKIEVVGSRVIVPKTDLQILSHSVEFISGTDVKLTFVTNTETQAVVWYGKSGKYDTYTPVEKSYNYAKHIFYLRDISAYASYNYLIMVRDEAGNKKFAKWFFGEDEEKDYEDDDSSGWWSSSWRWATGKVLAIPGAVWWGKNARWGRWGRVLIVNTLSDIVNQNDNYLSLREALTVEKWPRTVVFAVGWVFDLTKKRIELSWANSGYLTVACQTAPSPGVIIKTWRFHMSNISDIVMTHCVHRNSDTGNGSWGATDNGRGIWIWQWVTDVLIDHASISWATDENFQIYQWDYSPKKSIEWITLSNSIVSEGDADSSHPQSKSKQNLVYHSMWPSCNSNNARLQQYNPKKISITSNYIAHNTSRNGAIYSCEAENTNNIIYNWGTIGTDLISWWWSSTVFIRNNLLKAWNTTMQWWAWRCGGTTHRCAYAIWVGGKYPLNIDIRSNYYIAEGKSLGSAQLMTDHPNILKINKNIYFPWAAPERENIKKLAEKNSRHMRCIWASRPSRDVIDARVISEFYSSTGHVWIFENRRGSSHNSVKQRDYSMYKNTRHSSSYDTDKDGMSDDWERANGLDPNNSQDYKWDLDKDWYTNIEEFLADMAYCE